MSEKAEYLRNVNFFSQQITIYGVLDVNYYSAWLFSSKFYYFFIFLTNMGYFLCFTLMAKKLYQRWESNFYQKNILVFFTHSKGIAGYITNKKWFLIFLTVIERYSKSFMQKKTKNVFKIPLGLFSTGTFFCDILYRDQGCHIKVQANCHICTVDVPLFTLTYRGWVLYRCAGCLIKARG